MSEKAFSAKEFAVDITSAIKHGAAIQPIPMRRGDIKNGCLIRFRLGTSF